MPHPQIIQGGMGVGVSGWRLARAVARLGQLGVVSGTALAVILARRLQLGDPGGHLRRALDHFPISEIAQRALSRFYIPGGKPPDQPFCPAFPSLPLSDDLVALTVLGNFAEIFLAKEGHDGLVGVNYLEKVQLPTLPSLFGAMLAGVDYVLMGAGVPRAIPGLLDRLAEGQPVRLRLDVFGQPADRQAFCEFDPRAFCGGTAPRLKRPVFLAIVASATLAATLAHKSDGHVDGFVVEGPSAGGHNAPPRGPAQRNERGEPTYGPRDVPDLPRIRELGLPFWLAGSFAEPARLAEARELGAAGIQVGTAFAFCEESGLEEHLKQQVLDLACRGEADVLTDPAASPTGFPFKVLQLNGTLSDPLIYAARQRVCDKGYLRTPYYTPAGAIGYRCPAEPLEQYLRKGGDADDARGRKCLCSGLLAAVGLGQPQPNGEPEPPLLTAGEDVRHIARFLQPPRRSYTAADVIHYLLGLPEPDLHLSSLPSGIRQP